MIVVFIVRVRRRSTHGGLAHKRNQYVVFAFQTAATSGLSGPRNKHEPLFAVARFLGNGEAGSEGGDQGEGDYGRDGSQSRCPAIEA